MCGRYAYTLPPEMMVELFKTLNQLIYPPRYNIAPTQPVVAIWQAEGRREAHLARWGFMPGWVKDPKDFPLIINARAEGITDKPAFRSAIKNTRCIVPASGYYEWMIGPDKKKLPYYITLRGNAPKAFAGLYSIWMGPNGEEVDTVTICTTASGEDTAHLHDRMPVILAGDDVDAWLDTGSLNGLQAQSLLVPLPAGAMAYYPVSTEANSNRSEGPQLIEPARETVAEPEPRKQVGSGQLDLF